MPDFCKFWVDICLAEWPFIVRLIVILKLFKRRFETVEVQRHRDDFVGKVALQFFQNGACLGRHFLRKHIDCATVFAAHFVEGSAGVCS